MQGTRIVLIGGSGGIGHATASQLMARGAQVSITGRDPERLKAATATLGCEGHVLEASDFEATTKVLEAASHSMGGLDAVACLAGSILLKPITMTSQPEYEETILRNLTTAFSVTRAAIRLLTDGGSIVLMSSAAASMGLPNHEAIAAAKGGGWTCSFQQRDLRPQRHSNQRHRQVWWILRWLPESPLPNGRWSIPRTCTPWAKLEHPKTWPTC